MHARDWQYLLSEYHIVKQELRPPGVQIYPRKKLSPEYDDGFGPCADAVDETPTMQQITLMTLGKTSSVPLLLQVARK